MPLASLPFIFILTLGMDLSIIDGVVLALIWTTYLSCLFVSIYVYMQPQCLRRFVVLLLYSPLFLIVSKKPHTPSPQLFLLLETLLWDYPLIMWCNFISKFGGRALKPFFSYIDDGDNDDNDDSRYLVIGSLPFSNDVEYMKNNGVVAVVNMCREYAGPEAEYSKVNIIQHRCETPDICEPEFGKILAAISFIRGVKKRRETKRRLFSATSGRRVEPFPQRVFIHCKGGRARAVTMVLCYMLVESRGKVSAEDLASRIKSRHSSAEVGVAAFKVVARLTLELRRCDGDFERVVAAYRETCL